MSQAADVTNNGNRRNTVWIRIALLGLLISISIVLYKTGVFQFFLNQERMTSFLDSLGPLSFVGFIILQAAQVVLAPIPGEVTGLIGGYTYGPVLGIALSTTGLLLGSYIAFALSRAFGRPFVEKFIDKALMDRFDYLLHHKGLFLIFLLFLMPGFPKDYLCLILGLGHLSTMEFLAVSSVGRLFGTILLTLGGGYIRYHEYGKLSFLVGIAVLGAFLMILFRARVEGVLRSLHVKHSRDESSKAIDGKDTIIQQEEVGSAHGSSFQFCGKMPRYDGLSRGGIPYGAGKHDRSDTK